MAPSNLAVLNQPRNAITAKKRAKKNQLKEIIFDEDARRQFLTGFHKRKLEKAEAGKKRALERQKQERLDARREQRRMLREQALENAAKVESAYGAIPSDSVVDEHEEWNGISDHMDIARNTQKEEAFEDEQILATVTVVEDFDPDSYIHGPPTDTANAPQSSTKANSPIGTAKPKRRKSVKKEIVKKVRYETKEARKTGRAKQITRHKEKATRKGGTAARKKNARGMKGQ